MKISFFVNKSIKYRLVIILLIIVVTIIFGLGVSMYNQQVIAKEFNRFISNNTSMNLLSMEIKRAEESLEKYLRSRNMNDWFDYNTSNIRITHTLGGIRSEIGDNNKNLFYFRTLSNMHDLQQELAEELIGYEELKPEVYSKISYLRTLYSFMDKQAQELAISYLELSSSQYSEILERSQENTNRIFAVILTFSTMAIILSVILTLDITSTLSRLSSSARQLSHGNFDVPDIKSGNYEELNTLATAFNNMKKDIKSYIHELHEKVEIELQLNEEKLNNIEKSKLLKEAQLLTLQMQMNPHFLFNTLNMISRTAMFEDNATTIKLIEAISEIVRYNLEYKGKVVPLEKELEVVRAYIYIQEMRFQDRMTLSLNINGDVSHVTIPPMILQPIVENAVKHGLKDTNKDGMISIHVDNIQGYVTISVSDNGVGIAPCDLENILAGKLSEDKADSRTSIGIVNVKNRLELHFEQQNLFDIKSSPGQGTTVTIKVPLEGEVLTDA